MSKSVLVSSARVAFWFVAWVLIIDLGLNLVGAVLSGRSGGHSGLARYLEYGRSIEGKLSVILGPTGRQANPVISAGWLDPQLWRGLPAQKEHEGQALVAVYGQSFAFRVMDQARQIQPGLLLRKIGGPAAPLSHAHAAYQLDKGQRQADVVVVGVLASALGKSGSMSGLAFSFESPSPFTFPSHTIQDGRWVAEPPVLRTEQEFRSAFLQRGETWARFEQQLQRHNPGLDGFTLRESFLDRSALVRLARRGWVASQNAEQKSMVDEAGLPRELSAQLPLARHLLSDLQAQTSERRERLIVLLLQDKGSDRVLSKTLAPFLRERGIAVVDSADFINPRDARNFVADGHFTPQGDRRLAEHVLRLIALP